MVCRVKQCRRLRCRHRAHCQTTIWKFLAVCCISPLSVNRLITSQSRINRSW